MIENIIEKAFVKTLKQIKGAKAVKLSFIGIVGAPDRLILMDGFHCFIEFKRDHTQKPKLMQKAVGKALRKAGLNYFVISDKEEASKLLGVLFLLDRYNTTVL